MNIDEHKDVIHNKHFSKNLETVERIDVCNTLEVLRCTPRLDCHRTIYYELSVSQRYKSVPMYESPCFTFKTGIS